MTKPTMKDVATLAGVDTSTVSRALSSGTRHMISQETVDRVVRAADELRYRPNALARGLRTQSSRTIGIVVPDLTNPFFPPIVRGLEDALVEHGYTLIVVNTDNDEGRERAALDKLADQQVDGLVLATARMDDGRPPRALPGGAVVLVNRRSQAEGLSSVVPHDDAAVRGVVRHLVDLGHRRLAHVAGPQSLSTGYDRRLAFERACAEAGLPTPVVEVAAGFRREAGGAACRDLLSRSRDVTAVFAANDLLALGCLDALRAAGLAVPGDVSLVGYNDMPLVDLVDPPLTTVQVPQYEMGREAARLLLDELDDGQSLRGRSVQLPTHLVVRSSTAAVA